MMKISLSLSVLFVALVLLAMPARPALAIAGCCDGGTALGCFTPSLDPSPCPTAYSLCQTCSCIPTGPTWTPTVTPTATFTATATPNSLEDGQLFLSMQLTTSATANFNATTYTGSTTTEANKTLALPFAIRVTDAYVTCATSPSSAVQLSLRKNSGAGATLCTIPTSGTAACATNGLSVDYAIGDQLDITETTAISSAVNCRVTLAYTANGGSGHADAIIAGGGASQTVATGTNYCGQFGTTGLTPAAQWSCAGTNEDNGAILIPQDATVSGIAIQNSGNLASGATETFAMAQRTSDTYLDTALTLSGTVQLTNAVSASNATCSSGCAISGGTRAVITDTQAGTTSALFRRWAISLDGVGAIASNDVTDIPNGTIYSSPTYANDAAFLVASQRVAHASTLQHFRALVDGTPAAATTLTVYTATDPASPSSTAITCTIDPAAVLYPATYSCASSATVSLNAGDWFAVAINSSSASTGAHLHWSLELGATTAPTWTPTPTVTPTPTAVSGSAATDLTQSSNLVAWYRLEAGRLYLNNRAGASSCGGTPSNCNVINGAPADLSNFAEGISSMPMNVTTARTGGAPLTTGLPITFTVGAWVRPTYASGSHTFISNFTFGTPQGGFYLGANTYNPALGMHGATTDCNTATGTTLTVNTFGFITGSVNGTTGCEVSVNGGTPAASTGSGLTANDGSQDFTFAAIDGGTGDIDDIWVYTQATNTFMPQNWMVKIGACGVDGKRCWCDGSNAANYKACSSDADCHGLVGACDTTDGHCIGRQKHGALNMGSNAIAACNAAAP